MERIATWNRRFQIWQYSVSHSLLLLRSLQPEAFNTRIDVCFPAVSFMQLQDGYDSLTMDLASEEEKAVFLESRSVKIANPRGKLYLLNDGDGFVVSATCDWEEDEGDHHTPSAFGPLRGTE
jgi:hypothetical protein